MTTTSASISRCGLRMVEDRMLRRVLLHTEEFIISSAYKIIILPH
jgi:hypothetical protein